MLLPRGPSANLLILLLLPPALAQAQVPPASLADTRPARPSVSVARTTAPIQVDGRLDEVAWRAAPAATNFTQWQPSEGDPATEPTEVRFLLDDVALYVGARMYDSQGKDGIVSRLFRRDGDFECDYLQIVLDTFHDHLGRTLFRINPAGVKGDQLGLGGAPPDGSWDPVWEAGTTIDSLGWTAELRIPLDQTPVPPPAGPDLGTRDLARGAPPERVLHVELLPGQRVRGSAVLRPPGGAGDRILPRKGGDPALRGDQRRPARHGRPCQPVLPEPRRGQHVVGADFKYLLTSNLTLTGAVNPDFGQVEVDPAVVNLSAFETYFAEKRPFFVEGGGYFQFGGLTCFVCDASGLGLFYSRRIGRAPQGAGARPRRGGLCPGSGKRHHPGRGKAHRTHRLGLVARSAERPSPIGSGQGWPALTGTGSTSTWSPCQLLRGPRSQRLPRRQSPDPRPLATSVVRDLETRLWPPADPSCRGRRTGCRVVVWRTTVPMDHDRGRFSGCRRFQRSPARPEIERPVFPTA